MCGQLPAPLWFSISLHADFRRFWVMDQLLWVFLLIYWKLEVRRAAVTSIVWVDGLWWDSEYDHFLWCWCWLKFQNIRLLQKEVKFLGLLETTHFEAELAMQGYPLLNFKIIFWFGLASPYIVADSVVLAIFVN